MIICICLLYLRTCYIHGNSGNFSIDKLMMYENGSWAYSLNYNYGL